jgi:hypothetical protein
MLPYSRQLVNLNLGWLPRAGWQSNLREAGFTSRWTGFVNTGRPVSLRFQFGGSSYGSVGEFGTADRSLWGPNRDSLQLLEVI